MGIYNAQNQNYNSLMGGLLGLGAGAIKSDRREKENIKPLGTVLSAAEDKPRMGSVIADVDADELPIYSYSYKNDVLEHAPHRADGAGRREGQDPAAVLHDRKGTKYIDTHRVMGNILRAA